ncbi:P63C domain-containing protein [Bacteroides fragilis]|jgi:hypothetical protein|uniref:P63C domain-containing protein n=1 Tax=Bacteroides fragilis TaxID=817 RepID=UPI00202E4123|nr:P63C domain-containing protein [Bacteroides fragilis]MCE8612754.1 P63C domain-containing protein [Bacteroides fragilis]MCM0276850.1 P63C domain-containing protein [Bacteroides fragilis]
MEQNKIMYKGELNLNGLTISCYVLEDGRRVLSGRGMQDALKMVDEVEEGKQKAGTRLKRYLEQKSLKPFIFKDKDEDHFKPIICQNDGAKIHGYEATVLADICDAFLQARKEIELSPRQQIIADQCEILIRAFARVGIVALVDEATGYQYDREKDELQKILKAYISEELLPWQKRFPDIFYRELFRLNGWDFTLNGIKKRPSVIGKWTNTIIYEELPNGVLNELKNKAPKNESGNRTERYHQFLTLDVGEPNLEKQINKVITLFQVSDNMKQFWDNFKKMKMRQIGQMELPFDFDENGHTKD